ncbi:MAG: helix-turn-helix transcriptional regulator [Solirubrobacterales bacterium]|nr:helix-turn-helix transcriptional regulator [Solirubrobacterales bacterium]
MTRHRTEPEPVAKVFGDAVRRERKELGLTLEQLGERFGRPDGKYLGEIERGFHSPTITMAKQIADALGLPLAMLVADLDK